MPQRAGKARKSGSTRRRHFHRRSALPYSPRNGEIHARNQYPRYCIAFRHSRDRPCAIPFGALHPAYAAGALRGFCGRSVCRIRHLPSSACPYIPFRNFAGRPRRRLLLPCIDAALRRKREAPPRGSGESVRDDCSCIRSARLCACRDLEPDGGVHHRRPRDGILRGVCSLPQDSTERGTSSRARFKLPPPGTPRESSGNRRCARHMRPRVRRDIPPEGNNGAIGILHAAAAAGARRAAPRRDARRGIRLHRLAGRYAR